MNVLIVGAGPAGLTLAYWLHQAGHTATIVEKSETIRTQGYMIDFTGTGWDVADRMGIIPTIRQRAYPAESVIFKNADDKIMSQISVHDLLSATGNPVNYAALNRRDLVLTLYETVKDKVDICFGKTVTHISQTDEKVTATFTDDTTGEFDMLVGCDGIHSKTRQIIFGEEDQFTNHLGYQFVIFEIPPLNHQLGGSYYMYVEPNLQVGVYPTEDDKWLTFVIFKQAALTIPEHYQRVSDLKTRLSDIGWYVPEILEHLQDSHSIFWDNLTQIQMPQWHSNRVGIIGDAAYCPTLVSGQGASMAMAGAYFLAEDLSKTDSPQQAFQQMDNRLRPHITKIQQSAENFAPTFIPKSQFRIALTNWMLRLSNVPMVKGVIGKQFTVNSILT